MKRPPLPNKMILAARAAPFAMLVCLLMILSLVIASSSILTSINLEHGRFLLLGIAGAIFANSTGAGGGVVFLPVFHQMGFSEAQTVATSFGIQCFGMTAGAITWFRYYQGQQADHRPVWHDFTLIIGLSSVFSVLGIWHNYGAKLVPPAELHDLFSVFSILLGVSILATLCWIPSGGFRHRLTLGDKAILTGIAYSGGLITAWLSVGVGEVVAFYLILRRFDVTMAVAAAVVISAITVWSATPQHFLVNSQANWQVLAFAGPGAILGGILARRLVSTLSARRLKIFFGIWLLIIGFAS